MGLTHNVMSSTFTYTTALDKIRKMKSRKKVIQGGTSSGKTWSILPVLIDRAASQPFLEISVVSESIPHLRRGALKDFLKIMRMTNRFIPDNFNKSYLKYTFTNGSYIEFFSVDDESKLRGARRNILYVNEANNVKYDAYLQLAIRTSHDIYIDFNPTHKFWAHTEVLEERDSELIILTYKDNEGLPEVIVKELENNRDKAAHSEYWKNWWRVYGLGLVGVLEGVILEDWDSIDRVPNEARLIGYGMDFGYTNDPTTLIGAYKWNGSIIFDEVIYQKELTNSDIAALLKSNNIRGEIYADSAEPKSIKEISRYGYRILGAKKGRDSISYGLDILRQQKLLITKRSSNLIDELNRYSWKKDRDGAITKLGNKRSGATFKIL